MIRAAFRIYLTIGAIVASLATGGLLGAAIVTAGLMNGIGQGGLYALLIGCAAGVLWPVALVVFVRWML